MSKDTVNLIAQRRKQGEERERLRVLSVRIAIVLSMCTILGGLGIFILSRDTSALVLNQQKSSAIAAIMLLKDKASTMYILKKRIGAINTILKSRKTYDAILAASLSGLDSGGRVDSYVITEKTISVTATSPSLVTLNAWTDALQAQITAKTMFSKLSIDNFILDTKAGRYSLSVTLTYL